MSSKGPKCQGIWRRHQWREVGLREECKRCHEVRNPATKPLHEPKEEPSAVK